MIASFQHPDTGIPCFAEWNQNDKTLTFDFENLGEVVIRHSKEDVELVEYWCGFHSMNNCFSEEQGNEHLRTLGIKERLEY